MDYGYQLLRHVLQQVFGNIRQAAQTTLLLFLAPYFALILVGAGFIAGVGGIPDASAIGGSILVVLLIVAFAIFAYCWAAVGWHRYVLLEELGNGVLPQWRMGEVRAYFGRAVLVVLTIMGAVVAASLVIGLAFGVTQSGGLALVLGVGLVFGVSWLATRIGLVLPAAALGERMAISESWRITAPVSGHILLPLIIIAAGFGILGQLNIWVFGDTVTVQFGGEAVEQVTLNFVGQLIAGALGWLQVLINLALMTTLYGNLVEGRQLN